MSGYPIPKVLPNRLKSTLRVQPRPTTSTLFRKSKRQGRDRTPVTTVPGRCQCRRDGVSQVRPHPAHVTLRFGHPGRTTPRRSSPQCDRRQADEESWVDIGDWMSTHFLKQERTTTHMPSIMTRRVPRSRTPRSTPELAIETCLRSTKKHSETSGPSQSPQEDSGHIVCKHRLNTRGS